MVFGDRAMGAPGADAGSTTRFALHVMRGRWFMFFASILIMAAAGGTYIFGIYSKAVKTSLGYDQQTLNTLSFFKDVGANVGILPGLINEVTPPWVVLACGAGMNLVGYLMIYLAVSGRTARPPVWLMCVYIAVGANSQSFANTGALVTAVKNFPEDRGVVLGLLKGFVGLSGAIFTQLYRAIYGSDSDGAELVLLMAWLPAAISLVFIPTIRIMPRNAQASGERRAFFLFLYASIVLAVYLLVMNVVELEVIHFPKPAYYVTAAVLLLLIFFPIIIVVKQELKTYLHPPPAITTPTSIVTITVDEKTQREAPPASAASELPDHQAAAAAADKSSPSCFQDVFRPPARGQDYTILQALFSVDMLVLFVATICGIGGTLTAVDNMGQIGQSLGYPQRSITTFVSLVSIWNYAGRVASGFASEYVLARYKVPRPLALTAVLLLACVGHALIAFGVSNGLYAASVILGFCFGAQWPLLFAIISEVFGLKYYSTLYNFGSVASPVGSYILNVRITGRMYDAEALRQQGGTRTPGKDLTCIGVRCFRESFLIITGVTLLGALVSLVLAWRTREFYRGDLYGQFREVGMVGAAAAGDKQKVDEGASSSGGVSDTDTKDSSSSESRNGNSKV